MFSRYVRAVGSQSEPDRDLALPSGSANKLEPGDICAGDKKDQQRGTDNEKQAFAIIPNDFVVERTQSKIPALVKLRVALCEPRGDGGQFRSDGGNGQAGLYPPDDG